MGNRSAICTPLLKTAPQLPSSMTHHAAMGLAPSNRSATCASPPMRIPQPPGIMPSMMHREAVPIVVNRSAICTPLPKTAPQLPSRMTHHVAMGLAPSNRSATCASPPMRIPQPPGSMPSMMHRRRFRSWSIAGAICTPLLKAISQLPSSMRNMTRHQRAVPIRAKRSVNLYTALIRGDDQAATDDASQAKPTPAPELGNSFHFRNEMADFKNSDTLEQADMGHGPDSRAHGQHAARHDGLPPIQDADSIGPSLAEQNAADHARGAEHHVTRDLIV